MLLDHGAAIHRIHEELALLRELLIGRLPPPRASLLASSAATLPTPSTGPFAVETAEKMHTRQVSAAVRLQAAARDLLARRLVGRLLDLQLIQPRTPSQFLQAVRGDHSSATSGSVAAAGGSARLPSATATTKGARPVAGSGAALVAVAFTIDAEGCDVDSLDGYQQLCLSAAMSKGAHGVFPADDVLPTLRGRW
jgi:hypothetical protein